MERHLFVSDLDGTLLRSDATLSPLALRELSAMLREGLLFTVASARSLVAMRTLLRGLPLELPVVELNGALVSRFSGGEPLAVQALEARAARDVLRALRERDLHPFAVTASPRGSSLLYAQLANPAMRWYRDEKQQRGDPRLREVRDVGEGWEGPLLGFTLLDRREVLEAAAEAVLERCGDRARVQLFEHPYCRGFWELSVQGAACDKASGVARVLELLELTPDALTAFGDERNDLDLFRSAARAVAVKNAAPPVLAAATEIAESNDEDGVVRWLRRHWHG